MEKAQFLCIFSDRNIIRNVLLFCVVRVIYVLPKKERQVHIMKNGIRFTLEPKQRPKLAKEIGKILGTAPHYERVPLLLFIMNCAKKAGDLIYSAMEVLL